MAVCVNANGYWRAVASYQCKVSAEVVASPEAIDLHRNVFFGNPRVRESLGTPRTTKRGK